MTKTLIIVLLGLVGLIALFLYLSGDLSSDLETKGSTDTTAILTLLTAIVSLAGAMVTLVLKCIEVRAQKRHKE